MQAQGGAYPGQCLSIKTHLNYVMSEFIIS